MYHFSIIVGIPCRVEPFRKQQCEQINMFSSLVRPSTGCDQLRWRCTGDTRTTENIQLIHNRIQVKTQNRTEQKKTTQKQNEPGFFVAIPEVKMADKTLLSEELVNTSEIKAALNIQHGWSFNFQFSQLKKINFKLNSLQVKLSYCIC